ISPNNAGLRFKLGWCYNDMSQYGQAVEHLRVATQLKPEDYEAHTELGFALYKLNRLPVALEELRTAIRIKNDYALPHYYAGLVFIQQNNKVGAQEQYVILTRLDQSLAKKLAEAAPPNMRR